MSKTCTHHSYEMIRDDSILKAVKHTSLIIESSLKESKRYISEFSTESTECQCHCADHYDCYYSDHCYTEPAFNELLHLLRDTVSSGVSLECQFFTFVRVHVHAKKTCY